jgi:maltose alpha-D-glucosyltransferase/alpha-amylase
MLLAEANQWPEDTRLYFGGKEVGGKDLPNRDVGAMEVAVPEQILGDECHMAFHFPLMPRMYMAIAQEDRFPITDILRQTPDIPSNCQWAIFLRNHDELTLEMVTDHERDYLWNYYAADRRARINLGIRRRLAPLVERDRRRIELLHSLLLSMPGTPTLYYGDEIGMGDNIFLGDRDGVRTPMQWSVDRNGGFSRADTASLVLPPLMDPLYGFQTVNVEAQQRDPHSLLNWTRRMLAVRKQQKAFGRGTLKMLSPNNRRVLAYLRDFVHEDGHHDTILCVANLSRAAQAVELELADYNGKVPVEMTAGSSFPPIGELNYLLTLAPYGFYWFLLADKTQMPSWHVPAPERLPELMTLVIRRDPIELLQGMNRNALQQEALPAYLQRRRWFAGQNERPQQTLIEYAVPFGAYNMLCGVMVRRGQGFEHYQLPMGFASEAAPTTAAAQQLALARVRRGAVTGFVTDAFTLPDFARDLVQALREGRVLQHESGDIQFLPMPQLAELAPVDAEEVRLVAAEQSNSSVRIGEHMVLKLVRRVLPGIHPEAEMGAYLTRHGFTNIAPLLGEARRVDTDGIPHTLMILQRYLNNQGDAWSWTQNTLERAVRDQLAGGLSVQENQYAAINELKAFAGVLGKRLGEMHKVLAEAGADEADFVPQGTDEAEVQYWIDSISTQVNDALAALVPQRSRLNEVALKQADLLLAQKDSIIELVAKLALRTRGGLRIRVHGDLHLGQVLVVQGDACIIDFEGEPVRSLEERRARHSPLKDVAGMLRSFDYAAAMAMRNAQGTDSSPEAEQARRQVATVYLKQSRVAFHDAYRLATTTLPHAWSESGGENAALALFCIDKAAYEILYEARYRPDWLPVPVQGLLELTQHLLGDQVQ